MSHVRDETSWASHSFYVFLVLLLVPPLNIILCLFRLNPIEEGHRFFELETATTMSNTGKQKQMIRGYGIV